PRIQTTTTNVVGFMPRVDIPSGGVGGAASNNSIKVRTVWSRLLVRGKKKRATDLYCAVTCDHGQGCDDRDQGTCDRGVYHRGQGVSNAGCDATGDNQDHL